MDEDIIGGERVIAGRVRKDGGLVREVTDRL